MTVVNSMANDTETPEQKIKETLGYKDDPYSKVEIGVNLTTDSEMAEFDYNAQMAYVAQIQAGTGGDAQQPGRYRAGGGC